MLVDFDLSVVESGLPQICEFKNAQLAGCAFFYFFRSELAILMFSSSRFRLTFGPKENLEPSRTLTYLENCVKFFIYKQLVVRIIFYGLLLFIFAAVCF